MIFEQETIAFQILDVLFLEQENVKFYNAARHFDALSYRFEADTVIETNAGETELTDGHVCYFPSDINYVRTSKRDKMIVVHFKTFNYHATNVECFLPPDPKKYAVLFEEILHLWERKDTAYMHEASSVLNRIFSELYKDNQPNEYAKSKIYPSIRYIEQNCFMQDFSLQTAAKKSFVSDTYFRKLFKKEFLVSPKQYVIGRRIKYAASLIVAGYYSLEEIATLCGYNDYKHFSVEFKKNIGVSPSKYTYNYQK